MMISRDLSGSVHHTLRFTEFRFKKKKKQTHRIEVLKCSVITPAPCLLAGAGKAHSSHQPHHNLMSAWKATDITDVLPHLSGDTDGSRALTFCSW